MAESAPMPKVKLVSEADIDDAVQWLHTCPHVRHTPLIRHIQCMLPEWPNGTNIDLYLKLENMQATGSYKIRGVSNQTRFLPEVAKRGEQTMITMSAGNYGKAFGYMLQKLCIPGICVIPLTAPSVRAEIIKSYGISLEQAPTCELQGLVDQYVAEKGYHYMHPFDDINLIAGYASVADEILTDLSAPDIVVTGCGGGGLISGVSTRIKMKHPECRIYGVEPEGARTMYESFKAGHPVGLPIITSVAGGLAAPYAGNITYEHCRRNVDDIILVSDREIIDCVKLFYNMGLVVEPAGSAGLAALLNGRIPNTQDKKVVIIVTGSNITPDEMSDLSKPW